MSFSVSLSRNRLPQAIEVWHTHENSINSTGDTCNCTMCTIALKTDGPVAFLVALHRAKEKLSQEANMSDSIKKGYENHLLRSQSIYLTWYSIVTLFCS